MRAPVRSETVIRAIAVSLTVASSALSLQALAKDATPSPHMTRVAARKADHQLERNVRKALDGASVDTANVRVVARGNKVSLDGTVTDASQIQLAGTTAAGVSGVSSVNNMLSVQLEGH
jgi:hyperosmotically inducible periplasmic protein